jgi:ABC-type branched-subunit amino acid transport system substrate-binding protein
MSQRWWVAATIAALVLAGCSGGGSQGAGQGLGGGSTTTAKAPGDCNVALRSTEFGVSPTTITVTAMADVQNGFRPGLFKGSWKGVQAWADEVNSAGGLACRKVVVKQVDSKLSPTDSQNGIAAACGDSLAMVGTTALFLQNVRTMNTCRDKAGKATGIPDIADLQTEPAQQCSPVSFPVLGSAGSCPYTQGLRTFAVGGVQLEYYINKLGLKDLHGVFVIPKDVPSTIASAMAIIRGFNKLGVKSDAEIGESGTAIQTDYTQVAQALKSDQSNYARNDLDYKGSVLMRKEAQVQGVDGVKVWDCSVQCYDPRFIQEGGSAVEGQYVWLNSLPLEDKGHNATLDALLARYPKPDGFGTEAWIAGNLFAQAVNDTVRTHGGDPNSLTRANVLAAIRNMHSFDAGGMVPKIDVGRKKGSPCLVGMQVQHGKFVRIDPVEPGTFDCLDTPVQTITIDPAKEYHG